MRLVIDSLEELGLVDYIDCQEDWESLNSEFATVLVDNLLEFYDITL